ncbi:TRAP transporter substrate-binding protein [Jeotgalibacillus proteolyticus]|uniref:C4-dicarboxylate ABC transporter n=1 Tax=Jeotgalibacillus proteolyticus TaxID=2082395 RepID=A0A2S5G882_9BACL|nr:TRAP transporter substrate-binding protein [Jeotgalibacillus proteolyticus]PPA69134.1 C4-dicarboxylate ABC transporter [Jeotgalibacillus proteolyticus]
MKNKLFTGVLASALLLGACGSDDNAGGDSGDKIEWRFGHLADENHIWHQTAEKFAELVEENSDGQIEITLYPNNSLGGETDTINAIQSGTADMVISGETLQNWAPNAALMAVPYAFRDLDHVKSVVEGEIGDQIQSEIQDQAGLTALYYHTRAPRNLTSNQPIESPDDLSGFSMRVPNVPLFLDAWQAAGASPQVMDFNEVFTGLQQGVINGQENPVDLIQSGGLAEVQDYVNRTEHVYSWIYILVGNEQYNELSDELKEVVQNAAEEAQALGDELYESEIDNIEQELMDSGMEFVDVDQDAFREAMMPAIEASLDDEQLELYNQILDVE